MSEISMLTLSLKKQHDFDHFEVHIFAQSYNPFNLKIGEGLFLHVLLMFGAQCFQDYAKNRMLKLQNNKK